MEPLGGLTSQGFSCIIVGNEYGKGEVTRMIMKAWKLYRANKKYSEAKEIVSMYNLIISNGECFTDREIQHYVDKMTYFNEIKMKAKEELLK